jgi:histidinol-phosphatase (PHP family)
LPSQNTCPGTRPQIYILKKSIPPPSLSSTTNFFQIEKGDAIASLAVLRPLHEAFVTEAVRLRKKYEGQIKILIGFEGEWIRPSYSVLIHDLASDPRVDFFIGSVHHVHGTPIDYDAVFYQKARNVSGGADEELFGSYFDLQFQMLEMLRPKVVGHFDLIRLKSDEPDRDLRVWKGVWERIVRNLKVVVEQGALLEINTSALRKGLKEPYPGRSICEEFLGMGGKLTLSDDSHGIDQVGTNFERALDFVSNLGVSELWLLERGADGVLGTASVKVEDIRKSLK